MVYTITFNFTVAIQNGEKTWLTRERGCVLTISAFCLQNLSNKSSSSYEREFTTSSTIT